MRREYLAAMAAVMTLAACGQADSASYMEADYAAGVGAGAPAPKPAPPAMDEARSIVQVAGPALRPVQADAMLIRNGMASIEVDSLEIGIEAVRALAESLGGYVANTALEMGEQRVRRATLELRIPADRFDAALTGLEPIGSVESVNIDAQDVGEEYVDVTARLANARRLEERLIELLDRRTGELEDVLAVERELARVREESERLQGRIRWLESRVATSTLTVMLHEPTPLLAGAPGENPIVDALRDAWRNFVGFIAGGIAALGWLLPLAAVLALVTWVLRRVVPPLRWRRRAAQMPSNSGVEI